MHYIHDVLIISYLYHLHYGIILYYKCEVLQMIKAIFFDIDGTLLSHQSQSVPASTKKALKILKEKGIYTFIATGRHISTFRRFRI